MEYKIFSQDYQVKVVHNNLNILPKQVNSIRDKNTKSFFKTPNKPKEIMLELKFEPCHIHNVQLSN